MSPYDTNLRKFLPYNDYNSDSFDKDADDEIDPYTSDNFRMYEFKVRRCTRSRSHDWTDCPFAHPGEKARRRDPRRYHYSGAVCPEFRRGGCSRGDSCEFAHGVFECWLHPSRYRTEACKDGKNCKRKVCFFAHSARQLRILPEVSCATVKYDKSLVSPCSSLNHGHCCCLVCHSVTSSPTSTLLGMSHVSPPLSPSLSPPLSPAEQRSMTGLSPISRYSDRLRKFQSGFTSYKDVFTELVTSLDAMNFNEAAALPMSSSPNNRKANTPWIDVSYNGEDQPQFILSPSTPRSSGNFFNGNCSKKGFNIDDKINDNGGGLTCSSDPDLGWVNELLM